MRNTPNGVFDYATKKKRTSEEIARKGTKKALMQNSPVADDLFKNAVPCNVGHNEKKWTDPCSSDWGKIKFSVGGSSTSLMESILTIIDLQIT